MKKSRLLFHLLNIYLFFGWYSNLHAQCDTNYIYKGIYGGHAYFYSVATVSWEAANTATKALGGHLVTISSEGENTFVAVQVVNGDLAWIGLSDEATEGVFVWAQNEPFSYSNWGNGEPNNAENEDWVEINRNGIGKWNDLPAGFPRRYVVEFDSGDSDQDWQPDVCDDCPFDAHNDEDGDGLCANVDNCPLNPNTYQIDTDGDGMGDACDADDDNDGCLDTVDANPLVVNADSDCDGISDACDYCAGGDDKGPCKASSFPGFDNLPGNWACGAQGNHVFVCHQGRSICLSPNTIQTHLDHGDFLGPCVSCDLAHRLQFEMFPNPADPYVTLFVHGLEDQGASLHIFDTYGRLVWQESLQAGIFQVPLLIHLSDWPSGSYFVQVFNNRDVETRILVIAR